MMMFGFGWLMMLLVIVVPILLIVLIIGGAVVLLQNRGLGSTSSSNPSPVVQPEVRSSAITPPPARYCSHCVAGLQSDWTHCPQCGAPVG